MKKIIVPATLLGIVGFGILVFILLQNSNLSDENSTVQKLRITQTDWSLDRDEDKVETREIEITDKDQKILLTDSWEGISINIVEKNGNEVILSVDSDILIIVDEQGNKTSISNIDGGYEFTLNKKDTIQIKTDTEGTGINWELVLI